MGKSSLLSNTSRPSTHRPPAETAIVADFSDQAGRLHTISSSRLGPKVSIAWGCGEKIEWFLASCILYTIYCTVLH